MAEQSADDVVEEHVEGTDDAGSSPDSPRAHVIATGHIFFSVGLVFLLGACCFWGFSSHVVRPADEPAARWADYFSGDRLPAAMLTIGVATTLIGGFGLVAVGVGLQGERPSSGPVAVVLTALMAIVYWGTCAVLIVKTGSWSYALTPAVFALASTVLFAVAVHCAAVLRRFPPPPDQNVVTDEFLEEYRKRRRSE